MRFLALAKGMMKQSVQNGRGNDGISEDGHSFTVNCARAPAKIDMSGLPTIRPLNITSRYTSGFASAQPFA